MKFAALLFSVAFQSCSQNCVSGGGTILVDHGVALVTHDLQDKPLTIRHRQLQQQARPIAKPTYQGASSKSVKGGRSKKATSSHLPDTQKKAQKREEKSSRDEIVNQEPTLSACTNYTLYSPFFGTAGEPIWGRSRPLYRSYNGTGNDGLFDQDGEIYLVVATYDWTPDLTRPDRFNDNKVTFLFADRESIIVDVVYNADFPLPVPFAVQGGTGQYKRASGEVLITTDFQVNIYIMNLCGV